MTLRYLEVNEWYPVLELSDEQGVWSSPAEFTDEELADFERVCKEFDDWQQKLAARFGEVPHHYK